MTIRRSARRAVVRMTRRAVPQVRRLQDSRDALRGQNRRLRDERDRLRTRNLELQEESDSVRAENRRLSRRLDRQRRREQARRDLRYVFIVTYGRSGSTLLQAILNSTPGVQIRGENRGMLYELYRAHKQARRDARWSKRVGEPDSPGDPFFGIHQYRSPKAVEAFRKLALDALLLPDEDTRVTGFKEIRWDKDDLSTYVAFLRRVFPGAKFIVNTREHADVAQSKWWAKDPEALQKLERAEQRILAVATELGEDAIHVRYDDYVRDVTALREMFSWLGLEFDEERIRKVLTVRYSNW